MTEAEQLFEQVYRTYGPSLYRFCLIQMKNPADAEDILHLMNLSLLISGC